MQPALARIARDEGGGNNDGRQSDTDHKAQISHQPRTLGYEGKGVEPRRLPGKRP